MTRRQTRRIKIASTLCIIILGLLSVANTYTFGWRPLVGTKARPLTESLPASATRRLAAREASKAERLWLNCASHAHAPRRIE